MTAPPESLERGAVCLALYPFTPGIPLERVMRTGDELLARLERHESIDSIAATIRPAAPASELVVQFKLRRVLLLQDGRDPRRRDVTVARINSITDERRARSGWYDRLRAGLHPAHYLMGTRAHHGTAGKQTYVDLLSVAPIRKEVILRRTGYLSGAEMRAVSERLVKTLELDISGLLEELAGGG